MTAPSSSITLQQAFAAYQRGQHAQAEALARAIPADAAEAADALHLLAILAHQYGRHDVALRCVDQAIARDAAVPDFHNSRGLILHRLGRVEDAVSAFNAARRLRPEYPEALNNLANALKHLDRLDDAIAAYREALRLKPDYTEACCNLGSALKDAGELDLAVQQFRRALQLRPRFPKAHSHLIFTLQYHPASTPDSLRREERAWNECHAAPLRQHRKPHLNLRDPDRRLRIGYVSPDLRQHAVGRFLLTLLKHHDRERYEIWCYSDVDRPDDTTRELRAHTDQWRDVIGHGDASLAAQIQADQIDVLVDVTVHTGKNRLPAFALKPAPVQVTYLGYCGSTGLETMDYRLSDPRLDPPETDLSMYPEKTVHLPDTYWCYEPIADCPPVAPPPVLANGRVTFGSLNNFCKITEPTLRLWATILQRVPDSSLVLHATQGAHRERLVDRFAALGIDRARIRFIGHLPLRDYHAAYRHIDIGLDTHPYNGGTTTCDALWMGVPVVTLVGNTPVARAGSSILHAAGLGELITYSPEEYIATALRLANDPAHLAALREGMRPRLAASALMNAPAFVRAVEAALRGMWRSWCSSTR